MISMMKHHFYRYLDGMMVILSMAMMANGIMGYYGYDG